MKNLLSKMCSKIFIVLDYLIGASDKNELIDVAIIVDNRKSVLQKHKLKLTALNV